MALTFYPVSDDIQRGTLQDRLEILMEAAERFKAATMDIGVAASSANPPEPKKLSVPREQTVAYNWEEIAKILREIREMPEISKVDKLKKAEALKKLSEVYEVLRAAKMPKLEAVRLALINEANQLKGSGSQVA